MRKLEEIIMDCLYSFLLILCLLFVLTISIPLCILCTISWALYHLFECIFKSIKSLWLWILNKYQNMIDITEDIDKGE